MCQDLGRQSQFLWWSNLFSPKDFDAIVIPGGFSFGDYLRCGALAARTPVMDSVREFAKWGGPVLGICNGFQILCESGLLPGALLPNSGGHFVDRWQDLEVVSPHGSFGATLQNRQRIRLPIAHGDGRFHIEEFELKRIEESGQVWFRYVGNPNGSKSDIAGIMNSTKNVCGLMPHPERALHEWMGGVDGRVFL
jgi:phosphoribosylformylglycinamidine synthase